MKLNHKKRQLELLLSRLKVWGGGVRKTGGTTFSMATTFSEKFIFIYKFENTGRNFISALSFAYGRSFRQCGSKEQHEKSLCSREGDKFNNACSTATQLFKGHFY